MKDSGTTTTATTTSTNTISNAHTNTAAITHHRTKKMSTHTDTQTHRASETRKCMLAACGCSDKACLNPGIALLVALQTLVLRGARVVYSVQIHFARLQSKQSRWHLTHRCALETIFRVCSSASNLSTLSPRLPAIRSR